MRAPALAPLLVCPLPLLQTAQQALELSLDVGTPPSFLLGVFEEHLGFAFPQRALHARVRAGEDEPVVSFLLVDLPPLRREEECDPELRRIGVRRALRHV